MRSLILLLTTLPLSAQSPGRNYFFGDSLSDTGNIASIIGIGTGYPGDSFTNGTTWAGYFDPRAKVLLESLSSETQLVGLDTSVDLSAGAATTSTVLNQQIQALFLPATANYLANTNDRAFVWAGGNDFLPLFEAGTPLDPATVAATTFSVLENLTSSVTALDAAGLPNIAVVSTINLGLTPRGAGLQEEGALITSSLNSRLRENLRNLPLSANLLWIDSDTFLNDAISDPSAYNFINTTDPIAPQASDGFPSDIPVEEQSTYLFYDDIHPSTAAHEQFSRFVANHLALSSEVSDLNLVTDSTLALDDNFGFEKTKLSAGQSDFSFSGFYSEIETSQTRRQTTGVRSDLDYAISNNFLVGGEFFYADGEAGRTEIQSMGFGLDAAYRGTFENRPGLEWETGLGAGFTWGNMTRDYDLGNLEADSDQDTSVFTIHSAMRNISWKIGSIPARWEIGLKQRFVNRGSAKESDAASLNLRYDSETLSTTIVNLELGLALHSTLTLEFSLNPVLAHSGGEITARQSDGLATFQTSDDSGYDLHTARASLIYRPDNTTSISAGIIAGQDRLWSANLGFGLQF
ncbi:SGNH/GDSL hydrolase family protein [Akkermansiaceae bacterium]|nr:SGNH/GDSL hydrolase family protein [Akkermansiaceae bacterium]